MKTPSMELSGRAVKPESTAVPRLGVTAACLAARLEDQIEAFAWAEPENLGHLETRLAEESRERLRQASEAGAQKKAAATPPRCPPCQRMLTRLKPGPPLRRSSGCRWSPAS